MSRSCATAKDTSGNSEDQGVRFLQRCNPQSSYKFVGFFQYPKRYLSSADAGNFENVICQVLAVENGAGAVRFGLAVHLIKQLV